MSYVLKTINRPFMRKLVLASLMLLLIGCVDMGTGVLTTPPSSIQPNIRNSTGRFFRTIKAPTPTPKKIFKHAPYENDECDGCHNPSGSVGGIMKKGLPELCFLCHEAQNYRLDEESEGIVHSPVEDGACNECHHPHESKQKSLLHNPLAETCFGCHDKEDYVLINNENGSDHAPVDIRECSKCHNPHKSSHSSLLHKNVLETCLNCHEKMNLHSNVLEGLEGYLPWENNPEACTECHNPHVSQQGKLLIIID